MSRRLIELAIQAAGTAPKNEKSTILFPVGYPAEGCMVPDLRRKALDEIAVFDPSPVLD